MSRRQGSYMVQDSGFYVQFVNYEGGRRKVDYSGTKTLPNLFAVAQEIMAYWGSSLPYGKVEVGTEGDKIAVTLREKVPITQKSQVLSRAFVGTELNVTGGALDKMSKDLRKMIKGKYR
jgi:hypothetical protein